MYYDESIRQDAEIAAAEMLAAAQAAVVMRGERRLVLPRGAQSAERAAMWNYILGAYATAHRAIILRFNRLLDRNDLLALFDGHEDCLLEGYSHTSFRAWELEDQAWFAAAEYREVAKAYADKLWQLLQES